MNIDWIIPCRYAEVHDNLATIVSGGIDTWWLPELPAPVQVIVVIRLLAQADELGPDQQHDQQNIIRDPAANVLSDLSGQFSIGTSEEAERARTEWLNGIAVMTVVQFLATEPGSYSFEHIVDGSSKTVPLHVVHGLPPGAILPPGE